MNLVQLNERLKDLPMQVIQQYANGMNPEVPPYLALGELQRRETAQKQMATAQGGMSGPQPSIKEQVEQKAGLMAAQGLQQQQMMQQMAQQRAPGPVPAGMPQPEAQPTMMARGGLAHAPVDFNFQHGGIVAFSGGGGARVHPQAALVEFLKTMGLTPEEFTRAPLKVQNEIRDMMRAGVQAAAPTPPAAAPAAPAAQAAKGNLLRSVNPAGIAGYGLGLYHGELGAGEDAELERRRQMAPTISGPKASAASEVPPMTSPQPDEQTYSRKSGPMPTPPAPIADLRALADQQQRQQAPRPMPAPAAAAPTQPAAQPAPESMEAMLRAQLAEKPKTRTMEELLAEQRSAREGAGMTEPAGAAQMERLRKMQEQYEGSKPSGLDDLIRIFGQAGQYKGLSGMAPAYTANQERKRTADTAMAQKMNELMGGVETTQRGEMKDIATGALTGLGVDRAAGESARKDRMQVLGTARNQDSSNATQQRGQDITAESARYSANMHYKSAMAQMANANARQDMQEQRLLLDSFKTRIASVDKELAPMLKTPYGLTQAQKDQIAALQAEKAGLTKALDEASGISKMPKAPQLTAAQQAALAKYPGK